MGVAGLSTPLSEASGPELPHALALGLRTILIGTKPSPEARNVLEAGITTVERRADRHLARTPVTAGTVMEVVEALARYLTQGDGMPEALGRDDVKLAWGCHELLLDLVHRRPDGGALAVRYYRETPRATAAKAAADRLNQRPSLPERAAAAQPYKPLPAYAAAPPPEGPIAYVPGPVPVLAETKAAEPPAPLAEAPAPAASVSDDGGAFVFGADPPRDTVPEAAANPPRPAESPTQAPAGKTPEARAAE